MRVVLLWCVVALVTSVVPAAAAQVTAEQVARQLGFDATDRSRFLAGEVVTSEIEETTTKQLAIAIALLVEADLDRVAARILEGGAFESNPAVIAQGQVDPAKVDARAFGDVALGGTGEIERLLQVKPGSDLNLSSEEIERFRALGTRLHGTPSDSPEAVEAVTAAYREMLAARMQSYIDAGLAGIAPYDRGDGERSSAADDLRAAAEASTLLREAKPELYQAWLAAPEAASDGIEQRFFWVQQQVDGRPLFLLQHTMLRREPEGLVVLGRTFYAGHAFNGSQTLGGVLPVEAGGALFYVNRTSTDQVAGFMSGMRHKIGRDMMKDQLVQFFEQVRADLGQ